MSWLREKYKKEIKGALQAKFSFENVNQIPKLEKVIINCVTRDCVVNGKVVESILEDLKVISGQRAVVAKAKKSIASFKIREDQRLGGFVTLRGSKMYEFVERLVSFSLPRVRDFRGLSPKGFDGRGNYSMGVKEQIIFPEIDYDKIDKIRGMGISFVTTAKNNEEGRELLKQLGIPFKEK